MTDPNPDAAHQLGHGRPVETVRTTLSDPPDKPPMVAITIHETGRPERTVYLPADHLLIKALEQDAQTYTERERPGRAS